MINHLVLVRTSLALILCIVLLLPLSYACGPDFTSPLFTSVTGPDSADYANYIRGNLGILQPTYWHEPLYLAYRNLSGLPFTATELQALSEPSAEQNAGAKDWVEAWKHARAKLVGQTPEPQMFNTGHGITRQLDQPTTFVQYYNCLDGAFENAVDTLNKRVERFGAQSSAVKDWVTAQDQVFENCTGGPGYPPKPKPTVIPAIARVDDPAEIRADRAYQIAAAHFYASDFDTARADFEAIAKDAASPYSKLAPYLVARVLIRKGTLYVGDGSEGKRALAQAGAQLRVVLADKNLSETHSAAQRLLGFVNIRLGRELRFAELEKSLSTGSNSKTFNQDLVDYLWLLDRESFTNESAPNRSSSTAPPAADGASAKQAPALKSGDMTDWIFNFQQTAPAAHQHALQRWQETKSLPWLVAAIAKASPDDKASVELSAAAGKIAPNSPAFVTATFHRLRLLEQSGKSDATRQQLDRVLATAPGNGDLPIGAPSNAVPENGPPRNSTLARSSRNQFLALRMKLATNLEDFLRLAPRVSSEHADVSNDANHSSAKDVPRFDADASVILTEKLPLRLLAVAAKSATLPSGLRRQVAIAAWTRANLANNEGVGLEIVPVLQELVPEIKDDLSAYATGSDAPARQFAAIFTMLRNPGLRPFVSAGYPRGNFYTVGEPRFDRIDNLHDNWWCSAAPAVHENQFYGQDYYRMFIHPSSALEQIYPNGKISEPTFLTVEDRATAAKERAELEAEPAAPNWLGKRTLDYATAHPDDLRVPEALHLVVRARRYGCSDSFADNYSKPAFTLLHKRYPDNPWTKKTPYWFE
jgi:hypothetical protein